MERKNRICTPDHRQAAQEFKFRLADHMRRFFKDPLKKPILFGTQGSFRGGEHNSARRHWKRQRVTSAKAGYRLCGIGAINQFGQVKDLTSQLLIFGNTGHKKSKISRGIEQRLSRCIIIALYDLQLNLRMQRRKRGLHLLGKECEKCRVTVYKQTSSMISPVFLDSLEHFSFYAEDIACIVDEHFAGVCRIQAVV